MSPTTEQLKHELIDSVVEYAERSRDDNHLAVDPSVVRHYYERVAVHDLADSDPEDLYGAAVRHIQLTRRPASDTAQIRIYNPSSEDDGWTSSHTVVDIVVRDMPFIVDSLLAYFASHELQVHLLVHPMYVVERTDEGAAGRLQPAKSTRDMVDTSDVVESFVHLEIDRLTSADSLARLEHDLADVLSDVAAAVADWFPMKKRAHDIADELTTGTGLPASLATEVGSEPLEVAALLRWMADGAFVFTGYREYDFIDDASGARIVSRPATGLGILRQSEPMEHDLSATPRTLDEARHPHLLNITKTNRISTVHRPVPLDYIGIKTFNRDGDVIGERRFLGLFTSAVYTDRVEDIPVVRKKVTTVIERVDFMSTSHDHNRLLNALQTFPRDELFQIEVDELQTMALAILDLRDRRQVSLLVRRERFGRYLSCLVFVPRDVHSTDMRLKIQRTLMEMYGGTSVRYSTEIGSAPLARLHLVIYTDPASTLELPDTAVVEARLARVTRTWDDYLKDSLLETYGEEEALEMLASYGEAFADSYRTQVRAATAVNDIERLRNLAAGDVDVVLQHPLDAAPLDLRCRVYRSVEPITLSDLIPLFHDLGAVVVEQRPHSVRRPDGPDGFIYDLGITFDRQLDQAERKRVRDAILAVWNGSSETDGLAALVVTAGLGWRDVAVLRAYARYLQQIGSRFSFGYFVDTLNAHPEITSALSQLFAARLQPDHNDEHLADRIDEQILMGIDAVASLDVDQILRSFRNVILATTRTNHWQPDTDGAIPRALALKLDPAAVDGLPKPVPFAEIFVCSPRTEGVHLRAGLVARGGLRWSERLEDYRTEVLGLMKAQSVKNSVIVPVGAKGGFIVRNLPTSAGREAVRDEVVACYEMFVAALLDVSDNVIDDEIVAPVDTTRHDSDDPYLVVAADKGTATFSDIANRIAAERNFWLDDAFASGGSAGYDHKALAITARGAWVSVEHHFRELGIDPTTDAFTAVGIGDMSGDVFGNGMLLSKSMKLIAAFDHRHIFIDPAPVAAPAWAERQRLFALDRSTWDEYDRSLISAGGGVFDRSAKAIPISPEMREALDIDAQHDSLTPDELIQAVLRAPVDLLWNGGIGTYIRHSDESDLSVGDRGNDSVRISALDVRCKIVAEGGNLGVSQLGRVEYALNGGRINTDAIDNSGGVDCSDHEVNLKILLSVAERAGDLTRKHRDDLLESMADDVCELVLANNYRQNRTLATAVAEAPGMVEAHERLMQWLETHAGLDRVVEALPTSSDMAERATLGTGLTRPELAVLLAYTKNVVTDHLVAEGLPRTAVFDEVLLDYFPDRISDGHRELALEHPLRNELLATILSNQVVDRGGISMIHRLAQDTSATIPDIVRAHVAVWKIYALDDLWSELQAASIDAATHTRAELEVMKLGERAARWLLRNEAQPLDLTSVVERYQHSVATLGSAAASGPMPNRIATRVSALTDGGMHPDLAVRVAWCGRAYGFLDLTTVARRADRSLNDVSAVHTQIEDALDLATVRAWILDLPRSTHWQTMARGALRDQYFSDHAELAAAVLVESPPTGTTADHVRAWLQANRVAHDRYRRTLGDIAGSATQDLAHVSVALQALSQLRRAS